jgi:hypothetical protein
MKKLMFSLLLLCTFQLLQAQDKVAEYSMSYYQSKPTYDVNYAKDGSYYVYAAPLKGGQEGGMIVAKKDIEKLREVFLAARDKFVEWSGVARQNSVTKLTKEMELPQLRLQYYWKFGSNWYFDMNQVPTFRFMVFEDGSHFLTVSSGKLQSSTNQFIDSDGFLMVFSSAEEVDEFLACFDPERLRQVQESKQAKEELFK